MERNIYPWRYVETVILMHDSCHASIVCIRPCCTHTVVYIYCFILQLHKSHPSLKLGDPTVSHSLPVCTVAMEAAIRAIQSPGHAAGYVPACGTLDARIAIAQHHSPPNSRKPISHDEVIVANGCSGALELILTALLLWPLLSRSLRRED